MNERGRGSLVYQREVVGEEPDGGGAGGCRCRGSGAPAGEWKAPGEAPGLGEYVSVLKEARGGRTRPEFSPERR